jgi:hypothetical protein
MHVRRRARTLRCWWPRFESSATSLRRTLRATTLPTSLLFSACSLAAPGRSPDPLPADEAYAAVAALFTHATVAFPSAWNGLPAAIYCIDSPYLERLRSASRELEDRIAAHSECRFVSRPGRGAGEQRVRHVASDRPAVIYRFSEPQPISGNTVAIDFTWFGAYHFSAGYRCTLRYHEATWSVQECVQTKDYRAVG